VRVVVAAIPGSLPSHPPIWFHSTVVHPNVSCILPGQDAHHTTFGPSRNNFSLLLPASEIPGTTVKSAKSAFAIP
jgi:hypothetical protein